MLRWKQRSKRVLKELKLTEADILLVQEVDSYEEYYKKELEQLGYHAIYNSGNGKKHGNY
jgi:mRNA deadenylase 3'-5' endonuclease subunit Ccr4